MNEWIFLAQLSIVIPTLLGALRLGKGALITWISICSLLANLFVVKQINLFSLPITAADVYSVGAILGLNLLQEYYGKASAFLAIRISFFSLIFFCMISQLHLLFTPNEFDTSHEAFKTILSPAPRVLFASIFTFFIVQRFDTTLFHWIGSKLKRSPLYIRSSLATSISQLLDTVLFSILGLWGCVGSLVTVIVMSYIVKLFIVFLSSPFVAASKQISTEPRHT